MDALTHQEQPPTNECSSEVTEETECENPVSQVCESPKECEQLSLNLESSESSEKGQQNTEGISDNAPTCEQEEVSLPLDNQSDVSEVTNQETKPATEQDSKLKKIVDDFFNKIESETAHRILAKKRLAEAEKEK